MDEFETEYTENVVCPFCGYEDRDSWELGFGDGSDEEIKVACGKCEEIFIASRHIEITYSSRKKEIKHE